MQMPWPVWILTEVSIEVPLWVQEVENHMGGRAELGPTPSRGVGPSFPLPSVVCDMSFFKVKLVQEGLPVKQVVKWLRSNFKESWPTSKETAGEPEGDPACDGCETQNIASFPCPGLDGP